MNDGKKIYILGALLGVTLGVVSAHLYKRAADENADDPEADHSMSVQEMVSLGLVLLGVVRQIAEAGAKTGKKSS